MISGIENSLDVPMRRLFIVALLGLVAATLDRAIGAEQSDLDQLMAGVLARRDENWARLQQYVLDERERVELLGPSRRPLWGDRRDYTWFIRDGVFVRSPVRANGVAVPEVERRKYEDEFASRARAREKNGTRADAVSPGGPPGSADAFLTGARQPQFIDSAYFLRFKFEPGHYAFVGRERFAGLDVLRVEYYPEKLFSHEQDDQDERRRRQARRNRDEDVEASLEKMMNKVSLVTLWIEPTARQIVKYTFDNVDLDFLPGARLIRVDDLKAEMTMGQPFPDVWLPNRIQIRAGVSFAVGAADLVYDVEYHDYREASTSGRFKVVGGE